MTCENEFLQLCVVQVPHCELTEETHKLDNRTVCSVCVSACFVYIFAQVFLLCTVPFNSCLSVAFYYFGTCKYNSSKLIIRKLKKTLIVLSHNNWWFLVLELAISK